MFSYGPLHMDEWVFGRPARTNQQQLFTDTWCSLRDRLEVMDYRDVWRERELEKSVLAARYNDDDIYGIDFSIARWLPETFLLWIDEEGIIRPEIKLISIFHFRWNCDFFYEKGRDILYTHTHIYIYKIYVNII